MKKENNNKETNRAPESDFRKNKALEVPENKVTATFTQ